MLSEVLNNAPVQVQNKNQNSSSHLFPSYLFVGTLHSTQFSISLLKQSQSTITSSCNLNVPPTLKKKKSSGPFIQVMCSGCSGAQMQLKQNGDQGAIKRIQHKLNKAQPHKQMSRYMETKPAEIQIFPCLQTSVRAEKKWAGRRLEGIKEPPRVRTCRDGAFAGCELC